MVQKVRPLAGETLEAVKQEVAKLETAGFICKVRFQTWVANTVLVKKSTEKWRMCIDFTDLNKACPKDAYSLL